MRKGAIAAVLAFLGAALVAVVEAPRAVAQATSVDELAAAVLQIKTTIHPDGTTVQNLGAEREGSAVVIDDTGLLVTIGYLMVEAYAAEIVTADGRTVPAEVVGYDHESGLGLLRAAQPLKVKPLGLGKSAEVKKNDPVLVASYGGRGMVAPARVAARREFAGSWEYLLDDAIFTEPPHPAWSGAALIDRDGKLVGIGSLIVPAAGGAEARPGNMFVPIDRLPPILADLIEGGRSLEPAPPWLGLTTEEVEGRLLVGRVAPGGPAEQAGVRRGDIVIGVGGVAVKNLADFYRQVRAKGDAGVVVPVDVLREDEPRRFDVRSRDRRDHLKLDPTF
jgi:S1-C subfamily serine protease